MIIKSAAFEIGAVRPAQWPSAPPVAEFAFVGRSNVGKSSLLNRLLNRKSLARVSGTPGKTQQINFYLINETLRFADLPGYGYAAVSKTSRHTFARMTQTYLEQRQPLVRIFHLIDIRHPPSNLDVEHHNWLCRLGVPLSIIATKSDKVGKMHVGKAVTVIRSALNTPWVVLPVSSEKATGIEDVWSMIEDDLKQPMPRLNAGQ